MSDIISLSTPSLDWEVLARRVERSGAPLWLELDGAVHGVLLPVVDARRLMGRYTQIDRDEPRPAPQHARSNPDDDLPGLGS